MIPLKIIIKSTFVVAVLSAIIFLTHHFSRPDWNCSINSVGQLWSVDRLFKATILRKSCNLDETVFYSVRLDFVGTPSSPASFIPGIELENDQFTPENPILNWSNGHKLEITISTKLMSGTLEDHLNNDLVIIRKYVPSESNFPLSK